MLIKQLLNWYVETKRDLPWRNTNNPYLIWLSEIILQQTRVNQGLPYYYRFVEKYPSLQDLALASEDEVLRLWQGLGYYSRGRNLLFTAKQLLNEYDGKFPDSIKELKKLKGIGDYTAAAIGSIAFKLPTPAIDGNVVRVISRLFKISSPVDDTKTKKIIQKISEELIPKDHPDLYNQAMMELGALVCTPAKPKCNVCPLRTHCQSYPDKSYEYIPVKSKKVKVTNKEINYLVIETINKKLFLKKRLDKDIWFKMYDFPEIKEKEMASLIKTLNPVKVERMPAVYTQLTHRKVKAVFTKVTISNEVSLPLIGEWYTLTETTQLPKPLIIDNFIKELNP